MGTLPIVSASFPLNGREISAVNVNKEMISPLYSSPPNEVKYPDNSGIIMLKLEKNNRELKQTSQN